MVIKPMHNKASLELASAHTELDNNYRDSKSSNETKTDVFGTDDFQTVWSCKG